jgi:hypothetical protein
MRPDLTRRVLSHEIESVEAALERRAMADGLKAIGGNKAVLRELEALDKGLDERLPVERDAWWNV